jgi:FkbH-like protein
MDRTGLSRDLIKYIFAGQSGEQLFSELFRLIEQEGNNFAFDLAEDLADRLEAECELSEDRLEMLSKLSQPLARFICARAAMSEGHWENAIESLTAVLDALPEPEPFVLLGRARLLVRLKRMGEAAGDLKLALSLFPPYPFFIKCEKLLQKITASGAWKPRLKLKVALLGSATTAFLGPVLQAVCFRDGIEAKIYQGVYGNYQQEILNSNSGLYSFAPDVVILIPAYHDLALSPLGAAKEAERVADRLRGLWAVLKKSSPCHVIQAGFDLPPDGSWGSLEDTLEGGRTRIIYEINKLISGNLPAGISFLDMNRVALKSGAGFRSDPEWYSARQYPAAGALPLFAEYLTAQIRSAFGLSAKVLVLDLDNTLWGGVIGEDGLSGIVIGPPAPEGEAFLDLQRYVKELKERGVLLAVCSKNNLEDAELPFRKHDAMILKLEDFVVFTANWRDKVSNIEEIADVLSLGLDSFVFLDDNPLERAWVRARLPQVIVPECGNKPWEMLASLRKGIYFESISLTAEDVERHSSYRKNIERRESEKKAGSLEEFLAGLEMVAECGPVDAVTLSRVTQLINKTNQFNLTTRRYSEEQVKAMAQSADWWTRWYRLRDRFGNHGLIGIILAKKSGQQWDVDTWLMSCRVLGRKMEEYMCCDLLNAAGRDGALLVRGEYIPTPKNELVKDLFPSLGFTGDGGGYFFDLGKDTYPVCQFIEAKEV